MWAEKAMKSAPNLVKSTVRSRHTLSRIDEDFCSSSVGGGDDFLQWIADAQHVGGVDHTDESCALEGMMERLHVEREVLGDGHITQLNTPFLSEHLPRHDVGVVLHLRQNDGVALDEVGPTPSMSNEVDAFCCAAGDDDLVCVEALLEFASAGFVAFGRLSGQGVDGSVDVGVGLGVVIVHGVEDHLWLLGGRSVVEVDERVAVHFAL